MKSRLLTAKGTTETVYFLTGLAVLILAAMFVISLSNVALARTQRGDWGQVTGEVVAVGTAHQVKTLTIRSSELGPFPNNELNIFLNTNTKIGICNGAEPYHALTVGRTATIMFQEVGGVPVARRIAEKC